jgi:hypothetical protein
MPARERRVKNAHLSSGAQGESVPLFFIRCNEAVGSLTLKLMEGFALCVSDIQSMVKSPSSEAEGLGSSLGILRCLPGWDFVEKSIDATIAGPPVQAGV